MIKKIFRFWPAVVLGIILILLYHNWVTPSLISSGDFWPQYPEQYTSFSVIPYAWNTQLGNGFGQNALYISWMHMFLNVPIVVFGKYLHLPYIAVQRLGYLFPLLIFIVLCTYYWSKYC